jgi:lantibiotic modifying enzyme
MASALHAWALVSGDQSSEQAACAAVHAIARRATTGRPVSPWRDLIEGEAGTLLVLTELAGAAAGPTSGANMIADRLVGQAWWIDGLPDWQPHADARFLMPNFSHGLAGIGYALAVAGDALGRPDLTEVAIAAGHRLVMLGQRPDGTLAVPQGIPAASPQEAVSYGWCHGPTGTLRLFQLLDRQHPGQGWADRAEACRLAVLASGVPARRYPGFWDNLGQCCGTAGVGEMALDRFTETGSEQWLAWASSLAQDVLARQIADAGGVRWSHTEHRLSPPKVEPSTGWMQGTAGIAGWLLRLARVARCGPGATRVWWPDRPGPIRMTVRN